MFSTDPSIDRDLLTQAKGERTPGTCEWIVKHGTCQSWLQGDLNLLWIRGGPGKGKTMISIFLTQRLSTALRRNVVYYFCNSERHDATTLLRGLIWQLVDTHRDLTCHLLPYMDPLERRKATLSSSETLWNLLKDLACKVKTGRVYVLIDGLDECNEKSVRWLASKLAAYGRESLKTNMSVAVLSRQITALTNSNTIRLDPDHNVFVSADVEAYIRARVNDLSRQLELDDEYREHVVHMLLKKSEGTFLWVGFVMEELFTKDTISDVTVALRDVPSGLPAFYARMLRSIRAVHREGSIRLLTWVTIAFRRPTVETLVDVLRCQAPEGISQYQATLDYVRHCAPLLVVQDQGVEFVHQFARDCLLRSAVDMDPALEAFRIETQSAHMYAARRCLQALSDGTYLQYYALTNWPKHAKSLGGLLLELIRQESAFFEEHSAARDQWWRKYSYNFRGVPNEPPSRLHVACFLGLEILVRFVMRELEPLGSKMNELLTRKCNSGWSPFDYAAEGGDQATVELLLSNGSYGTPDDWWDTVHDAFDRRADLVGHLETTKFLLDRGANPGIRDQSGRWPLQQAILKKHKALVQLLLARGVSLSKSLWDGWNPLQDAIATEDVALVRLILAHGPDVHAPGADKMTPIAYSISRRPYDSQLVRLLLEHGAVLNSSDMRQLLRQALRRKDQWLVQWLLTHGSEPNVYDSRGRHLLHGLYRAGHVNLVKLLLDHGADPDCLGKDRDTLLHLTARAEHQSDLMTLLLDKNANVNARDARGNVALHIALLNLQKPSDMVQVLLAHHCDPDARNHDGDTALHLARGKSGMKVARLLIDGGANPNLLNVLDETPLHVAADSGEYDVAMTLIRGGADVRILSSEGYTALHVAAMNGHDMLAQFLCGCGIDVNAPDRAGRTALHLATLERHSGMMTLLVGEGAEIDAQDCDGATALHHATARRDQKQMQLLSRLGADLLVQDMTGITALRLSVNIRFVENPGYDAQLQANFERLITELQKLRQQSSSDEQEKFERLMTELQTLQLEHLCNTQNF